MTEKGRKKRQAYLATGAVIFFIILVIIMLTAQSQSELPPTVFA